MKFKLKLFNKIGSNDKTQIYQFTIQQTITIKIYYLNPYQKDLDEEDESNNEIVYEISSDSCF